MHFRFIFMTAAEMVARWTYIPAAFDPSHALTLFLAVSTVLESHGQRHYFSSVCEGSSQASR